MTFKRIVESAAETKQRLLRVVSAAAVIVVASTAAFGVTSASATLPGGVEKVVGAAGSAVPAVTETVGAAAPGAVSPAPPPSPSPPAAAPDTPQAPAPPSSSPAPPLADSVTKAVGQVADVLADEGTTETPKKAAAAVTGTSKGETKQVAPSARSEGPVTFQGGRSASAPTPGGGSVVADAPSSRSTPRMLGERPAPPSVGSARPAPLRRWLAYVWPAIALGRNGEALAKGETLPPLTLAGLARLLVMGATRASGSGDGDPMPSAHATPPDVPRAAPNGTLVPGGAEITSFVIFSFAALLALLISAAWMEVRSKYLYR